MNPVSHIPEWIEARLGASITDEQAWAALEDDSLADLEPRARAAVSAILRGPTPVEALQRASRLPPRALVHPAFPQVAPCLHQGGYPARLAGLVPEGLDDVPSDGGPIPPATLSVETLLHRLEALATTSSVAEALGRVRTAGYIPLCVPEARRRALEEVCAGLSNLAEACVRFAVSREPILATHTVVFGMGKLAGRELNFHSDIDLVFIHAHPDAEGPDGHPVRMRVHEAIRRVVATLEGDGRFRPLFRVDLRLRPFGSRGPISTSYGAAMRYFETHGRGWERQVWMRARPIAGDLDLGHRFLRALGPFVYRSAVSPAVLEETRALSARARRPSPHTDAAGIDVKHDRGCIREIEFFVQSLLLLHGGKLPDVQTPSTMGALDRLLAHGLISDDEHALFSGAYRRLRRLEHRAQLEEGLQTHSIGGEHDALALLAVRVDDPHRAGPSAAADGDALERELAILRQRIIDVCDPVDEREPTDVRAARLDIDTILDPMAPDALVEAALVRLGAHDGPEAFAMLRALRAPPQSALHARGEPLKGATQLLLACLASGHPERALSRLVAFSSARPSHFSIWRTLGRPGQERSVRLIAELLGLNPAISQGLVGVPHSRAVDDHDLLEFLLSSSFRSPPSREDIAAIFTRHLDRAGPSPDAHAVDAALRMAHHRCLTRVALHDLAEQPDPRSIGDRLTAVADEVLRHLLNDEVARSPHAVGAHAFDLGVFALGKHGMSYLDYGSDLDLIFVYRPLDISGRSRSSVEIRPIASDIGVRLMARLRSRAAGAPLYEVDTRLRPSGQQGLLVSSAEGFARYHDRTVPVWERVASLWLRPVAVARVAQDAQDAPPPTIHDWPSDLVAHVRQSISNANLSDDEIADDIDALRHRIQREISRETRAPRLAAPLEVLLSSADGSWPTVSLDAKLGPGGCLDLELAVGAMVLRHRHRLLATTERAPPGIHGALDALAEAGFLTREVHGQLDAAYGFHRRLLNRLRMDAEGPSDGSADAFMTNSPRLPRVARRMGLEDESALLHDFLQHRRTVRSILPPRSSAR